MIESYAVVVGVVSQVVMSVSLVILAGIAILLWKSGSLLSGNTAPAAPTAQAPSAPEEITQLTDDQWKEVVDGAKFVEGNVNAKVTMVEFTDFQCPFCSRYFTDTYGQLKAKYIDTNKIRYIVRNLPLSFHKNAHISAQAAACAGDQKKFFEMHNKLFTNQAAWSEEADPKATFEGYAREIGLNVSTFSSCLSQGKMKALVDADAALAGKVGANGTPTFIVNGKVVVGAQPMSAFESVIDEALK